MSIIVQTNRIIVREFLPAEESIYLNHFTDEMVIRYIPKRSVEERIGIFRKALDQYSTSKKLGIWGMFNKADGDFVGSCLLRLFNTEPGKVELGYSIEQKYWGMGLGTEMATAMVAYALSDPSVSELMAVTVLENAGSQHVLGKAGLKRMDNIMRNGDELAYFKILPGK